MAFALLPLNIEKEVLVGWYRNIIYGPKMSAMDEMGFDGMGSIIDQSQSLFIILLNTMRRITYARLLVKYMYGFKRGHCRCVYMRVWDMTLDDIKNRPYPSRIISCAPVASRCPVHSLVTFSLFATVWITLLDFVLYLYISRFTFCSTQFKKLLSGLNCMYIMCILM